jgi:hypothetical protein
VNTDGQPVEGPHFVDTPEEAVNLAFELTNTGLASQSSAGRTS